MLAVVLLVSQILINWYGITLSGQKQELKRIILNIGNLKLNTMVCGYHSITANVQGFVSAVALAAQNLIEKQMMP